MILRRQSNGRIAERRAGLTLIELIVAFTVLLILSTMALPLTGMKVQREKERRLRLALEEMRTAIDRYKDAADAGQLGQQDPDNHGYPESLEILVEGVEVSAGGAGGPGGMLGMGGMPGQQQDFGQQGFGQQGAGGRQGGVGGRQSGAFGGGQSGGFGQSSRSGGSFGSQGRSGSSGRTSGNRAGGFGGFGQGGLDDEEGEKKMRFLRKIPVDPITGMAEWGFRSISDDPSSMSWGGSNVFDVYSLSMDTALDGTRYSDW